MRTKLQIICDKFLWWLRYVPYTYFWYRRLKETAKRSAKRNGVPTDLNTKLVKEVFKQNGNRCHYCGMHNNLSYLILRRRLTVDRVVPKLGYVKSNIVPACYLCNQIKSNFISSETMRLIGPLILKDAKKFFYSKRNIPHGVSYSFQPETKKVVK